MNTRILKVNSEIQKAVSEIISYEMQNPLISGIVSITKVDTTPDLDYCRIYVSIFSEDKQGVFDQIKHSAGFIRKTLASKINLRKVPFLSFYLDSTYEDGARIDEALEKINIERANNKDENR